MPKITLETSAYNDRRYSKPWIAKVIGWDDPSGQPEILWGSFVGRPGEAGMLVIEAEPGDMVRKGQKDNRPSGRYPSTDDVFGIVSIDGEIEWIGTGGKDSGKTPIAEAYLSWIEQQSRSESPSATDRPGPSES